MFLFLRFLKSQFWITTAGARYAITDTYLFFVAVEAVYTKPLSKQNFIYSPTYKYLYI
jgi:hypothetical protein